MRRKVFKLGNPKGQAGQTLPIVLCVLAIGGLTIAGSLNFSTTTLKGGNIVVEKSEGTYAAEAGIENVLWSLLRSQTPPTSLGSSLNRMTVSMQTSDRGVYSLFLGGLDPSVHNTWIIVTGNVTLPDYTITVTRLPGNPKQMKLLEVGAVLPAGYNYVVDSAAAFPGNLSTSNPSSNGTISVGNAWVRWQWASGSGPEISTGNQTQQFRITGYGSTDVTYAWVNIQSQDVGFVGEITGQRHGIEAVARRVSDGRIVSRVTADILIDGLAAYIISWKVSD